MCLYGIGLLPILPIGFMVSSPRPYKHIANLVPHRCGTTPPHSGLSSCESKWPHAVHVIQLLSTCRLENPPHVRRRVESCPTSVRDKVCYVLIWSWVTSHIANWFYGGTQFHHKYESKYCQIGNTYINTKTVSSWDSVGEMPKPS
ncbi:hypothetical protein DVH24_028168 [Malus domestica]|uniref:Uncharacterized protein n=1 Tax=Malus domestica TaxID=3750 RepID=A0A498HFW0_MALDO|nr:hypothetical protein DVH24_028168 [Malus domestica]